MKIYLMLLYLVNHIGNIVVFCLPEGDFCLPGGQKNCWLLFARGEGQYPG